MVFLASLGITRSARIPLTGGRVIIRDVTRGLGKGATKGHGFFPNLTRALLITVDKLVGSSIRPLETILGLKGTLSHRCIRRPSDAIRRRVVPSMLKVSNPLAKGLPSSLKGVVNFSKSSMARMISGTG